MASGSNANSGTAVRRYRAWLKNNTPEGSSSSNSNQDYRKIGRQVAARPQPRRRAPAQQAAARPEPRRRPPAQQAAARPQPRKRSPAQHHHHHQGQAAARPQPRRRLPAQNQRHNRADTSNGAA